jgi:hypothetical protein
MLGGLFGDLFNLSDFSFGAMGIIKEYANPQKIFLDFDFRRTPKLLPVFTVLRMCGLHVQYMRDDRTRKGWHRIIKVREKLSPAELVALQACLGSDRRREGLNLMRLLRTRKRGLSNFERGRWNILYSRKLT